MKKRLLVGTGFIVLGGLIALGPQYLFKICEQTHHSITKCFWAAQGEIGIGAVIGVLGIGYVLFKRADIHLGFSIALALNGILAFLIPHRLIGVCEHPDMACRLATLPALTILSIATVLLALVNIVMLKINRRIGYGYA
jgi:hypothetical protein